MAQGSARQFSMLLEETSFGMRRFTSQACSFAVNGSGERQPSKLYCQFGSSIQVILRISREKAGGSHGSLSGVRGRHSKARAGVPVSEAATEQDAWPKTIHRPLCVGRNQPDVIRLPSPPPIPPKSPNDKNPFQIPSEAPNVHCSA